MKWTRRPPQVGDSKTITKFLLFPRSVYSNDVLYYRWLERVKLTYRYTNLLKPAGQGWILLAMANPE